MSFILFLFYFLFASILDAYRKGAVHMPKDTCGLTFRQELEFWELAPSLVAPCCLGAMYSSDSESDTMTALVNNLQNNTNFNILMEQQRTWRENIWLFLDEPKSSIPAFVCRFHAIFSSTGLH